MAALPSERPPLEPGARRDLPPTTVHLLRLDSVSAARQHGGHKRTIVEDVSLTVRSGEVVGVYGARGSGKTTLLHMAAGMLEPDSGAATFDGRDVAEQQRAIAWVGQADPAITDLPTDAQVALPLFGTLGYRRAQRAAMGMLAKVGATEYASCSWLELPTAIRPSVAIAHALISDPAVLIVDDAACGLSAIEREHFVGLLRLLAEDDNLAVLFAASDTTALSSAHRLYFLSRGRLVAPDATRHHNRGA